MFEKYNQLAKFSIDLSFSNIYWKDPLISYAFPFSIILSILVFIIIFIVSTYDNNEEINIKNFFQIIGWCFFCGFCGFGIGLILSMIWSLILLYICPVLLISSLIFFKTKIIKYIGKIYNIKNKKSKNIIKDTMKELKAEELAKQAWENLKKDFPDIKYETVLKNIKSKM